MLMKKSLPTIVALAGTACLQASLAQQAPSLAAVQVTATRTDLPADQALAAVTVITRADIERLQPVSVQDLLAGLPGISFATAGGLGQQTSLFVRGTNSNQTLVLLDGVRIGSVTSGAAALEQIPVEQIDRIEIVRGPRSSLYGADAIGGVIQIFTRHGQPDGATTPSLSVTSGSRNYLGGQLGVSGGDAHAWYNASLGGQYTSGIPACRAGAAEANAGCFVDASGDDAFRNYNGLLNAGYRWDNGTELAADWLRSKSDVQYAGSPAAGNDAQNQQEVAGLRLSFTPLDAWKVSLGAGQSRDDSTRYYQGYYPGDAFTAAGYYAHVPAGDTNSTRNQFSWQNDLSIAPGQLLSVGTDYQQERIASDTGYLDSQRDNTGGYAQYQGQFGANQLQLSLRRDHNQQFGDHSTGAAAWGYHFEHGLKVFASWGSAFHAPDFNDLYYPFGSGNPDLKPEKSRSIELGLAQQQTQWNWSLNAYQTRIDQLITLNSDFVPYNIDQARIRGLEAQFGAQLAGWQLHSYLTLQQPLDDTPGSQDGNLLARRPERTARLEMDRQFGAYGFGATWYAAGRSFDDADNLHRLGGYSTTDLRASWQFAPHWQVQARLANAFDRRYETAWFFNQPGRSWFLTWRYTPGSASTSKR
jgi:vitamin B12 transporter